MDQYLGNAGLVEDEAGQARLLVGGGLYHEREWWLWRAGAWQQTVNSMDTR